jgi:hypothetical protein
MVILPVVGFGCRRFAGKSGQVHAAFALRYFRPAAGALVREPEDGVPWPVVPDGVVTGACTVLPPGAASGMELRGWGDGA